MITCRASRCPQLALLIGLLTLTSALAPALKGAGPLWVENRGQWRPDVLFAASGSQTLTRVEQDRIVLVRVDERRQRAAAVALRFAGGAALTSARGREVAAALHHFFLGADPARWRRGVDSFEIVEVEEIYRGVTLQLRWVAGQPEYDLILTGGTDLAVVEIEVEGASSLCVDSDGSLVIQTTCGTLRQPRPLAWQVGDDGAREAVECDFVLLSERHFGIDAADRDRSQPLFVDPGLLWSSYLGGGGVDEIKALQRLPDGSYVVAGVVSSSDLEIPAGAYDLDFNGAFDVYVAHVAPQGAALLSATYLGGTDTDTGTGLSVHPTNGDWLVTGYTWSPDFPVTPGALDVTHGDPTTVLADAFVTRLAAGGSQLAWSTFLGGPEEDLGAEVAWTEQGDLIAIGSASPGFPLPPGALQPTVSGPSDGFIVKLAADGTTAIAGTLIGGSGNDELRALAPWPAGGVYAAGSTSSRDLPISVAAAAQPLPGGLPGAATTDAFAVLLSADLARLLGASYFGGTGSETLFDAAVKPNGQLVVCGRTDSAALPFPAGAYLPANAGGTDAFAVEWRAGLTDFAAGTFLGGTEYEQAFVAAVTSHGIATVCGTTHSPAFPVTAATAFASSYQGGTVFGGDIFVTRFDARMTRIQYSSFVGSSDADHTFAIAGGGSGRQVVVAGLSFGSDFPTTPGAYATAYSGGLTDSVLFELELPDPPFLRADANEDGIVTIADGVTMLAWLFSGGDLYCPAAADFDGGGSINIADPIALFTYLFAGGAAPAAPFPQCGTATAGTSIDCDSSACP